jgi:hypothetical protein
MSLKKNGEKCVEVGGKSKTSKKAAVVAVALWRCRRAVAVFKRHAAAATRHVHIGVRIAQRAQRVIEWSSGDVDSI